MRTLPLSPQDDGERMDRPGGSSGSNVVETHTAVAVVDLWTGSTVTDVSSNGVDDDDHWDSGYQREIIDGVTVYYGGDFTDLCDSDIDDSEESDWEDPVDVARREYVEDYNFYLLEDMEPMVFVSILGTRLDWFGVMSTSHTCMTGMMPVFRTMIRLWIVNVGLGENIVLRFFGRDLLRFHRMLQCRDRGVDVGTNCVRMRMAWIRYRPNIIWAYET